MTTDGERPDGASPVLQQVTVVVPCPAVAQSRTLPSPPHAWARAALARHDADASSRSSAEARATTGWD